MRPTKSHPGSPVTTGGPPAGATITRHGAYCVVEPDIPALRRDLFTVSVKTDLKTCESIRTTHPLLGVVRPESPSGLFGPAGLESVITDWLRLHGHEVAAAGERPGPLPACSARFRESAGRDDLAFLEFVRRRDTGLVRHDPAAVDPVRLAARAAAAWPKARLAVTTATPDEARMVANQLRGIVSGLRLVDDTYPRSEIFRVAVADHSRLGDDALNLPQRDIWLDLRPQSLVATDPATFQAGLPRSGTGRRFALLPFGLVPAPFGKTMLEAVYGRDRIDLRTHGRGVRSADIVFLPVVGEPAAGVSDPGPDRLKRHGLWRNAARNAMIVRLAKLLRVGDPKALRREFPQFAGKKGIAPGARAVIRVETREHADAVRSLLPDLPVIGDATPDVPGGGLPGAGAGRWHPGADVQLAVGTENFAGPPVRVLVQAAPVAALHDLSEALTDTPDRADRLLVVDFLDTWDPRLRDWSRDRAEYYADSGWDVTGGPVRSPWERFRDEREAAHLASPANAAGTS